MANTTLLKKITNILAPFGNKVAIRNLNETDYYVYIKTECMGDYLAVERELEKDKSLSIIGDSFMWCIYIGDKD